MLTRLLGTAVSLVLVAAVAGCTATPVVLPMGGPSESVPVPSDAADRSTPAANASHASSFPKPHRKFTAHFNEPLYLDEGEEFAPFGNDEGWDTMATWSERRCEFDECTTVRWLIENNDQAGALDAPDENGPDVDGLVIGAGFALLHLTGRIDVEGRQLTLDALHRTYSYYSDQNPRELAVMIRDLEAFPGTDCPDHLSDRT